MDVISLVVPCYNEQETLPHFYKGATKLAETMPQVAFEFIYVNDGSKDNTLQVLRGISAQDSRIKYISFSRNFGKEAAMLAGLSRATGDYVAIVDADLQHPLELVEEMYRGITTEQWDCVAARRISRAGEPAIRSFFSRQFYKIMNRISDVEIVSGACDFRLMTRQMVDAILSMKEYNRFSKGIFSFVGFDTKWIPYENTKRVAGETSWSFWGLVKYSLEGILAFSTAPLRMVSVSGVIICLLSLALIVFTILKTLFWNETVAGYPTIICVLTFLGGTQLLSVGVLGEYLGKLYLESKDRPIYIIKEER